MTASAAETRERLIQAGIRLFGEHGYRATSTRMLAEAAEANIGSIAYHFANKHGLYLAAAGHIADQLRERLAPGDAPDAPTDRDAALDLLREVVRRMVRTFAADDDCRQWLLLVMREQIHPGEAFEILQGRAFGVVQTRLATLIGRLTDRAPDDRRVVLETHTLVGQIVFFLIAREPLLRRLGLEALDATTLAEIEAVLDGHLDLYAPPPC
ncbi:CerR family C-terminal domain-containing protein [Halomonas sp. THAF12]|uniref:CerR family C-terminal domain-containing protein n=1 Tax=Halomonas sp. B23F22_10 TaxID=3459515 RepID=UPI00373F9AFF